MKNSEKIRAYADFVSECEKILGDSVVNPDYNITMLYYEKHKTYISSSGVCGKVIVTYGSSQKTLWLESYKEAIEKLKELFYKPRFGNVYFSSWSSEPVVVIRAGNNESYAYTTQGECLYMPNADLKDFSGETDWFVWSYLGCPPIPIDSPIDVMVEYVRGTQSAWLRCERFDWTDKLGPASVKKFKCRV